MVAGGASDQAIPTRETAVNDLTLLFLKLGTIGFGGPTAHIAMMEDEVVRRKTWISHERFLDRLGATNVIPGPNSTQMALSLDCLRVRNAWMVVFYSCVRICHR